MKQATFEGTKRVTFEGTAEQFNNLKNLLEWGSNDLPTEVPEPTPADENTPSLFRQYRNGTRTGIGSFEYSLYETYYKGSGNKRAILVRAFPDFFNLSDETL